MKKIISSLSSSQAWLIIIIIGWGVFANALFNGFAWDDYSYILQNPEIHRFDLAKIFGPSFFNVDAFYRPLPALYFSLTYILFKEQAFFHHFCQISLHIVNAGLLFLVLKRFLSKPVALLSAIIFLIHPLQVESVSYIASATSPLFFLFGILAVWKSLNEKISWQESAIIGILLTLSLLTKESGLLFVIMVLVYRGLYYPKSLNKFLPMAVGTVVTYLVFRFAFGQVTFGKYLNVPIAQLDLTDRILNIPAVIGYYVQSFFVPLKISMHQQWVVQELGVKAFVLPVLLVGVFFAFLFGFGWHLFQNQQDYKPFVFFLVWWIVGLGLISQLLPLDATVADRWFYFPIVGLVGMGGLIAEYFKLTKSRVFWFTMLLIILLLSVRTIARNANWKNNLTLLLHDSQIHTNYAIEGGLGIEYGRLRQYDQAIFHFQNAVALYPCEENFFNLAYTCESKGELIQAKEQYLQALGSSSCKLLEQDHQLATYLKLGRTLLLLDEPGEAQKVIEQGVGEYPQAGNLWALLAVSQYQQDNLSAAKDTAMKAVRLQSNPFTQEVLAHIESQQPIEMQKYLK